jgi:hypothetical protein
MFEKIRYIIFWTSLEEVLMLTFVLKSWRVRRCRCTLWMKRGIRQSASPTLKKITI